MGFRPETAEKVNAAALKGPAPVDKFIYPFVMRFVGFHNDVWKKLIWDVIHNNYLSGSQSSASFHVSINVWTNLFDGH